MAERARALRHEIGVERNNHVGLIEIVERPARLAKDQRERRAEDEAERADRRRVPRPRRADRRPA